MQDSRCDSDIDCTHRKLKILYECRDFFSQIFIFSNFWMFFEHFKPQIRDIYFFSKIFKIWKNQDCKRFIYKRNCSTSLSGGNQVDGSPPAPSMFFELICRLRNLFSGNRTEAISRNLNITVDDRNFSMCNSCVRSILTDY